MDETEREELKETYRKEKDPRMTARMPVVHMVYVRKAGIDETAVHLMRSARWYTAGYAGMTKEALTAYGIFHKAAGPCRPAVERHRQITHRDLIHN